MIEKLAVLTIASCVLRAFFEDMASTLRDIEIGSWGRASWMALSVVGTFSASWIVIHAQTLPWALR